MSIRKTVLGIGLAVLMVGPALVPVQATPSKPCAPPASGTWVVQESCTISQTVTLNGDLRVVAGAQLTVTSAGTLDLDLSAHKAVVEAGGRIVVQQGGKLR